MNPRELAMADDARSRLGRGLASLIGDVGGEAKHQERPRTQRKVPIEFLKPNPRNPRRAFSDTELDIDELKSRIAAAVDFMHELPRATIDRAADREVIFRFRSGVERKFTGRSLLLTFSVPQFFFHLTTAYDILRHAGVDLAKKDFLGTPRQQA